MGHLYRKENGQWMQQYAEMVYRKENGQWVKGNWGDLDVKNYIFELLSPKSKIHYVSLGDSIAAGHTINENWSRDYGEGSQYGNNGRSETVIVPDSYTDLIRKELVNIYGASRVSVKSFARSGDRVEELAGKLNHATVRDAISQADIVTICIGANNVLEPAFSALEEYITTGSLSTAEAAIANNMERLNNDSAANSYVDLFNKLVDINPKARYVFTTIYNPYKYLHLEEGQQGFFKPMLDTIPQMNIDVDKIIEGMFLGGAELAYYSFSEWRWIPIELEIDLDGIIKEGLLHTDIVQLLFNRVNGLGAWAEKYVTQLNTIIRNKVSAYQTTSPNFAVAETKAMFDLFPDKTRGTGDVDFSDLVSVEFTKADDTMTMDWGALWRDTYGDTYDGSVQYWNNLAWDHLIWKWPSEVSLNVFDYVEFDLAGFAADLVAQVIEKVIVPNVDPHPEWQGHQVMKRSFTNVWGLTKYEPNGGESVPGDVVLANRTQTLTNAVRDGHRFDGWYADSSLQQKVNTANLTDYKASHTLSDLVSGSSVISKTPKTTTAYAKWSAN